MNSSLPPLCAAALTLRSCGDALLALDAASGTLQVVQGLDSWLLLGWRQGLDAAQLQAEYAAVFPDAPLTQQQLAAELQRLLDALDASPATMSGTAYQPEYQAVLARTPEPVAIETSASLGLDVGAFRVQLASPEAPELLGDWRRLCAGQMLRPPYRPHVRLDVRQTGVDRFDLDGNGLRLRTEVAALSVMPLLMDLIQVMHYQRGDYLLAVHAALVRAQGAMLILPGVSGAGKSTLCAHLAAHGYQAYSDELAVLRTPDAAAQSAPLPLAVKSGSWALLQPTYPELATAPVWERPDGRRLKYLALPPAADTPPTPPVRQCVVFPQYDAACAAPELQPLSPLELLIGLTQAGYQLPRVPDPVWLEHLLDFAEHTPAYRLRYARLSDAQRCLTPLLRAASPPAQEENHV